MANRSPAVGTSSRPETSTGVDGPASWTGRPRSFEHGADPAEAGAADQHLAFGETSGGFRRLIQIVFGLSTAFAASSFFLSFFQFGGGALI